jgi:hypothetical protein
VVPCVALEPAVGSGAGVAVGRDVGDGFGVAVAVVVGEGRGVAVAVGSGVVAVAVAVSVPAGVGGEALESGVAGCWVGVAVAPGPACTNGPNGSSIPGKPGKPPALNAAAIRMARNHTSNSPPQPRPSNLCREAPRVRCHRVPGRSAGARCSCGRITGRGAVGCSDHWSSAGMVFQVVSSRCHTDSLGSIL